MPDEWRLPVIYPDTEYHRQHMETWCDGTALRAEGGVGPPPSEYGFVHLAHMSGYCAARAAVHEWQYDLWALPPGVLVTVGVAFIVLLLICGWVCCACSRLHCRGLKLSMV